jgi:hypothetical protein
MEEKASHNILKRGGISKVSGSEACAQVLKQSPSCYSQLSSLDFVQIGTQKIFDRLRKCRRDRNRIVFCQLLYALTFSSTVNFRSANRF